MYSISLRYHPPIHPIIMMRDEECSRQIWVCRQLCQILLPAHHHRIDVCISTARLLCLVLLSLRRDKCKQRQGSCMVDGGKSPVHMHLVGCHRCPSDPCTWLQFPGSRLNYATLQILAADDQQCLLLYRLAGKKPAHPVVDCLSLMAWTFLYVQPSLAMVSRCFFAWSIDGLAPKALKHVSRRSHVPDISIIVACVIAITFLANSAGPGRSFPSTDPMLS